MIVRRILDRPQWGFSGLFEELEDMRQQMDRLFARAGGVPARHRGAGVYPQINLSEDKDRYFVRAELPGVKSDELNLSATGSTISISGERKIKSEPDNVRYHRREREAGSFNRSISLPTEIDADRIEAGLQDGILNIVVPKAEAAKPRQISVR
jgi:HSP20 family protein